MRFLIPSLHQTSFLFLGHLRHAGPREAALEDTSMGFPGGPTLLLFITILHCVPSFWFNLALVQEYTKLI